MTIKILTIALLTTLFLNSCNETPKQQNAETTAAEAVTDDIVTATSTDKDGKTLKMTFNNTKGTATLYLDGKTIELVQQRAGSGVWYKNEHYEFRGKGDDIALTKDGKIIFEHKDDIVKTSLKDKDGQTLDMVFNNTTNQAKIYLNGGEQIELVGQYPASGIWYKNDHYELRGKGEDIELTKDGKIIFKK